MVCLMELDEMNFFYVISIVIYGFSSFLFVILGIFLGFIT